MEDNQEQSSMRTIKLGIVGEAMRAKIKQKKKLLTDEEINYLAEMGYAPRGVGYVDLKTNKFVSDAVIDKIIADFNSKKTAQATAVSKEKAVPVASNKEQKDPVYNVVKSIATSISEFVDLIVDRDVKPSIDATAVAEKVPTLEEVSSGSPVIAGLMGLLAGIASSIAAVISLVAMPIYNLIKDGFGILLNAFSSIKRKFLDDVLPFFTSTIPNFFEDIKDFFAVDIPKHFNDFISAAKGAIQSLLDIPQRIIDGIQNYGVSFGKSVLDKFGPWLETLGVNTDAAAADIKAREKRVAESEANLINQQKARDLQAKKEQAARDAKYAAEKKTLEEEKTKRRAIEQAKLEEERKQRAKEAAPKEAPTPPAPVAKAPTPPAPAAKAPAPAAKAPAPAAKAPAPAPVAKAPAPVAKAPAPPTATPAPAPAAPAEKVAAPKKSLEAVTEKEPGVKLDGLKPAFKDRVAAMASDFEEKTGKKLLITSAIRSNEKQKKLFDAKLAANNGDVAKTRKMVAEPAPPLGNGTGGAHIRGEAIDFNSLGNAGLNELAGPRTKSTGWLESFGLFRTVPGEDWHLQARGTKPAPDNPDNPGAPILIPGSTILFGGSFAKDVTSKDPDAKGKSKAPSAASAVSAPKPTAAEKDLLAMPTKPVADAIDTASKKVGVDLGLMYAMAKQESTFDPNAGAKGKGAKGLYQFLSDTWNETVKQNSKQFPELLKGPLDPLASAIAGALYIKKSIAAFTRNKIPVNATTIYAGHFLGQGGAMKLFSLPKNTVAAEAMPGPASNNVNIFYKDFKKVGKSQPRTVGEVINVLFEKVGQYEEKYNVALGGTGKGTQLASATQAADIKAPKMVVPAAVATGPSTASTMKTAAAQNINTPVAAAVINQYKNYFSLA